MAPAFSVLSQGSADWENVEVGGFAPEQQKEGILEKIRPLLGSDAFVVVGPSAQDRRHDQVESLIRDEAEALDDAWRERYESAADTYREAQQQGSTLLILADQIDNNLSLYRTELESARSKRDGFFHSFSGLGKSYIVHVRRRLMTEEEQKESEDSLAFLTEDCAKRSLAKTRRATLVLSEFGITPDDTLTQGATIVVSSADVVSQGSPPAWGYFDGDGGPSFDYVQAYNVFPQYKPEVTGSPLGMSLASLKCQATELKSLESLPELPILQDEETRTHIGELMKQRDTLNERVRTKFEKVYSTFSRQMAATSKKLDETQDSLRKDLKSTEYVIDQLITDDRSDDPLSSALLNARREYARSEDLLGSGVDFDAALLDEATWEYSLKSREDARSVMVEVVKKMVAQAAAELSEALSDRSLILWQRENRLIQGNPRDLAATTVEDMINVLNQRAERLRSYKVFVLEERPQRKSQKLPTQVLTSVVGTDFYQPGLARKIVFPEIRHRWVKENPQTGKLIRSLEIFLAIHFFYERKAGGYVPPLPPGPEPFPPPPPPGPKPFPPPPPPGPVPLPPSSNCRQVLESAAAQEGPIRSGGEYIFLYSGDAMTQAWYVLLDQRLPRGRLDDALSRIPCFGRWRLPEINELRALAGHLNASGRPQLSEGLWSSEDDGLGTEWRVFFPEDGHDEYRGRAHMQWFAAVTDSPPSQ